MPPSRMKVRAQSRMSSLSEEMYNSRHDKVKLTDLRTSMNDARIAFSFAAGRLCDRNGYFE